LSLFIQKHIFITKLMFTVTWNNTVLRMTAHDLLMTG